MKSTSHPIGVNPLGVAKNQQNKAFFSEWDANATTGLKGFLRHSSHSITLCLLAYAMYLLRGLK